MSILKRTGLMIVNTIILAVLLGSGFAVAVEIENLIDNGGFENGTNAPWAIGGSIKDAGGIGATMTVVDTLKGEAVPEDPIEGKLCLLVTVEKGAAAAGAVQFMTANNPPVYKKGEIYTLSAFITSDDNMQFHLLISGGSEDGFKPSFQTPPFVTTNKWEEYHLTTDPMPSQPVATRAKIFVGYGPGSFWIDDIKIYIGEYVPATEKPKAVAMISDKLVTNWASIKSEY